MFRSAGNAEQLSDAVTCGRRAVAQYQSYDVKGRTQNVMASLSLATELPSSHAPDSPTPISFYSSDFLRLAARLALGRALVVLALSVVLGAAHEKKM